MSRAREGSRTGRSARLVALLAIGATALYPLYFMAVNAFKSRDEYYDNIYGPPRDLYLENFSLLEENLDIIGAMGRSLAVVVAAVAVSTLLAALASFPLAKLRFGGRGLIFAVIVAFLLVPGQVLLIPIYLFFSKLDIIDNPLSVVLVYIAISIPFGTFLLTSSFRGIPSEVIESARIDGASMLRTFRSIILPMGRPAVLTLAILNFLNMWNELLLALLLLPDETKRMLTPALTALIGGVVANPPLLMSGLLVGALPTIVVFAVGSKYIIRGVSLGVGR